MMRTNNIAPFGIAVGFAAGTLLAPGTAIAEYLKAGLWKVTTAINFDLLATQIPPEQLSRLRSLGIRIPSSPEEIATQQCLTREQSLRDTPPHVGPNDSGCTSKNGKVSGRTMSADLLCTGRMVGQGTLQLTHTDEEHYSGSLSFKGTIDKHPVDLTTTVTGEWLSKDCR
jgi:hypothetical protein